METLREKFVKLSRLEILGEDEMLSCVQSRERPCSKLYRNLYQMAQCFMILKWLASKSLMGATLRSSMFCLCIMQVLIGCDGVGSVVAKYMNMGEPDGHNLSPKLAKQRMGRGVRAGIIPMDANRVYWFVVFKSAGEKLTDVLNYVKGWPPMMETLSRRAISDRWMWPVGGPPLYKGGVTLAGDAMHPMAPNLGQGGCCALEDAVILARVLSKALPTRNDSPLNGSSNHESQEVERIELALKSYTEERWPRMLPMAMRSYLTGALLQVDTEPLSAWFATS